VCTSPLLGPPMAAGRSACSSIPLYHGLFRTVMISICERCPGTLGKEEFRGTGKVVCLASNPDTEQKLANIVFRLSD
jgi:hypothetical protein